MKITKRHLAMSAAAVVVGALGAAGLALWFAHEPEIARIDVPPASRFDRAKGARGEQLASIGDCIVCHTAENGTPFAGARALPTPFGTLYSNNITPDTETGIGNWSEEAFRRAMKEGVGRDGSHLYPALPYEHFTHVSDDDLSAIYAFLMTRQPVRQVAPENRLLPGLGFRPLLAGWKLLFLHDEPFRSDEEQSAEWNRGKYLVEGLGHCGGCHTARNLLGGEEGWKDLAGGIAEGWNAPPLDATNPSAAGWSAEALFTYLKTGVEGAHSAAAGPMGPVTEGLSRVNDADVKAISNYIAWRMGHETPQKGDQLAGGEPGDHAGRQANEAPIPGVAELFEGACAGCHGGGAPMMERGRPGLDTVSDLLADDPRNAIQAVLQGIPPKTGEGPYMPPFNDNLTDRQVAELLAYARSRFTDKPAWSSLEGQVADIRKENAQ